MDKVRDDFELHGTQTGRFKTDAINPSAAPKEVQRHKITGRSKTSVVDPEDIMIHCECGARWSHQKGTSEEKIQSVFESHVRYAQRMATRVD